jgi:HEAT repeat protein
VPVGIPDPCIDRRVAEDEAWRLDWGWQVNCQTGLPLDSPFGERIVDNGSLSAQANRVFRRTRSYLWCLGDPNQPFPAPKDCPPAARIPPALPEESTRRQVLTECEGQPTETALPRLTAALADPAEALRTQALTALVKLGARAVPALLPALASPQPSVRFCAARFFAEVPTRESIEPLIRLLGDPYRDVRSAATEALAKAGPEVAKVALAALRSKEAAVRSGAVNLVGPGDDTVVTALLELLDDPEEAVRANVKKALSRTGTAAIPSLQKILQGATGLRQREAIELAGLLGDQAQSLVPVLVPLLQSSDSATRLRVTWALGEIGPAAGVALPRLLELAREADPNDTQVPIVEAMKKIQPQSPQLELFAIIQNLRTCPGPQILKYADQAAAKGEPIVPLLIRMLDVARPRPAGRAAVALGKLGPPAKAALPALKGLLAKTDDKPLKEALAEAIARIEGTASQP